MRTQGATIVAAALVLIAAAPASAVTGGFGVAKALQAGRLPILMTGAKTGEGKLTSCHAGPRARGTAKTAGIAEQLWRKVAPVACEQPPRSQFLSSDALKQATSAALSVLG